jgi:CRP/FNR family transcriptional regulator
VTQQQLASEIGTAREVVSRTLARFRREGWIRVVRGRVELLRRGPLDELARRGGVV